MPRVSEVMTRDVVVIHPDASVQHAAQVMDELNVGSLPVCEGGRLVGVVTDRDITVRATAVGLDPNETRISEVMTDQTRWCTEDESTDAVMRRMGEVKIRRLPVLDEQHRVIGIVALGDLAAQRVGDVGQALCEISSPSEPDRAAA
jgi:CBS domain-containing protein